MKKRKTLITRDPVEFNNLVTRWKADANKAGYKARKTDIKRQLAKNMGHMNYRPDIGVFKPKDLFDDMFPVKKKRGKRK